MEQEKQDKQKNMNKFLLIVIGIVVIVLIIFVLLNNNTAQENAELVNETNSTSEIINENVNDTKVINNDPEAIKRDEQRMADIEDLREKLAKFNYDKGNYPETMDELVTEGYYEELPVNPTPGGIDYVYTPIGSLPAKFYDLAYSLEAGINDLEPGEHIANPESIAFP